MRLLALALLLPLMLLWAPPARAAVRGGDVLWRYGVVISDLGVQTDDWINSPTRVFAQVIVNGQRRNLYFDSLPAALFVLRQRYGRDEVVTLDVAEYGFADHPSEYYDSYGLIDGLNAYYVWDNDDYGIGGVPLVLAFSDLNDAQDELHYREGRVVNFDDLMGTTYRWIDADYDDIYWRGYDRDYWNDDVWYTAWTDRWHGWDWDPDYGWITVGVPLDLAFHVRRHDRDWFENDREQSVRIGMAFAPVTFRAEGTAAPAAPGGRTVAPPPEHRAITLPAKPAAKAPSINNPPPANVKPAANVFPPPPAPPKAIPPKGAVVTPKGAIVKPTVTVPTPAIGAGTKNATVSKTEVIKPKQIIPKGGTAAQGGGAKTTAPGAIGTKPGAQVAPKGPAPKTITPPSGVAPKTITPPRGPGKVAPKGPAPKTITPPSGVTPKTVNPPRGRKNTTAPNGGIVAPKGPAPKTITPPSGVTPKTVNPHRKSFTAPQGGTVAPQGPAPKTITPPSGVAPKTITPPRGPGIVAPKGPAPKTITPPSGVTPKTVNPPRGGTVTPLNPNLQPATPRRNRPQATPAPRRKNVPPQTPAPGQDQGSVQ